MRWNEDRAQAAVEGKNRKPLLSYSGHLQHILNLSSERVLGKEQVKDYTKPSEYTGKSSKRINIYISCINYIPLTLLYSAFYFFYFIGEWSTCTGRCCKDVIGDPDLPEEAAAVE